MQALTSQQGGPLLEIQGAERRGKPRVVLPFLATALGVSAEGDQFRAMTVTDDLSAGGLHLCLLQRLDAGAPLLVVIHLAGLPGADGPNPHVFFEGDVRRAEALAEGYGYGVVSRSRQLRYLKFVNALALLSPRTALDHLSSSSP
jgi:hypothetical protein